MTAFCPKCGTPRSGSFRFCRSCGLDFDGAPVETPAAPESQPEPVPASSKAAAWVVFFGAIVVIAGFVWLWVNTEGSVTWIRVFFLFVGGIIWLGIVWVVMAVVALIGGLGAALTLPFWRRR